MASRISFYGGDNPTISGLKAHDTGTAIDTDNNGNIYFGGDSWSINLPVFGTSNTDYDGTNNFNGTKAYLFKLNSEFGTINWGTYLTGQGHDASYVRSIEINSNGNIFVGGHILRTTIGLPSSFPLENGGGSYYTKDSDTKGNAYITEFDPDLNIIWSTLLGCDNGGHLNSDGYTLLNDIKVDQNNNLVIVGNRKGSTLTGHEFANNNMVSPIWTTIQGGHDGFIMKFDGATRTPVWSTLFGGSDFDGINSIAFDSGNNIYITGTTSSSLSENFPAKSFLETDPLVINDPILDGENDAFLSRFKPNGEQEWTTYFGKEGNESGGELVIDSDDNIYFTGRTNSADLELLPLMDAYHQPLLNNPDDMARTPIDDGTFDTYILVTNGVLQKQWTTFIGGYEPPIMVGSNTIFSNDNFSGLATSSNKYLFFGGSTRSNEISFPTEDLGNGAYFQENNIGGIEGIIGRFTVEGLFDVSTNLEITPNQSFHFELYPNPSNKFVNINLDYTDFFKQAQIEFTNANGKVILTKEINNQKIIQERFNLKNYPKGVYFISIVIDGKKSTKKIILN